MIQHLLDAEHSPIFNLRSQFRNDKIIAGSIQVFLRNVIRLDEAAFSKSSVALGAFVSQSLVSIQHRSDIPSACVSSLHRTARILKLETSLDEMCERERTEPLELAESDTVFSCYIVLDAMTAWTTYRQNGIYSLLRIFSTTWHNKATTTFDACVQMLTNAGPG